MVRGETTFICTNCKNEFIGMDVEYRCMVFSWPMPCPHCGSIRTLPVHAFRNFITLRDVPVRELIENANDQDYPISIYKDIWDGMEREKRREMEREKQRKMAKERKKAGKSK